MLAFYFIFLGFVPNLLSLPATNQSPNSNVSIIELPYVPLKMIVDYAGVEGRLNLAQTCQLFRTLVNEKPDCEGLAKYFSASMACPEDRAFRQFLLDLLYLCPNIKEVQSTKLDKQNRLIDPLYITIQEKHYDVAKVLVQRRDGDIPLQLHPYPRSQFSKFWDTTDIYQDLGLLYYNPVWPAIDHQQFDLVHSIIQSPLVKVFGVFRNGTRNPNPISNPSFFIPHLLSYFCSSDEAQRGPDSALAFCYELLHQYPKDAYQLASCDGIANYPQWAFTIFQKDLIKKEVINEKILSTSRTFPYAGNHSLPIPHHPITDCFSPCDCAIASAVLFAFHGSNSSMSVDGKARQVLVVNWIKGLYGQPNVRHHRRSLLRLLMKLKEFSLVMDILENEAPQPTSWFGSYHPFSKHDVLHPSNHFYDANFTYDEVLLLDSLFFGNHIIIQHYLQRCQFLRTEFKNTLVENLKTCTSPAEYCIYGRNLQIPQENFEFIETKFLN